MNSQLKYIEDIAEKALALIQPIILPIPIDKVAEKCGLKVIEFDFPDSCSGILKKERGVIGVNKNHHVVRRRFTIAHELGHFLLGHGIGKEEDVIDDDFDKPQYNEKEANLFASCVLMPKDLLKEEVKKGPIDLKRLAPAFNVSEQAMTIRLLELNLL